MLADDSDNKSRIQNPIFMKFDYLNTPDTGDLYRQFISHVTKTDQDLAEEARKGKQSTTELKLFIARNRGFSPSELDDVIHEILQDKDTNQNPQEFFEQHHFEITRLNEESFHLIIKTPKYEREDDFLLINSNGYLKALSVIRRKWTKKTIEKLIQYLDSLERLFITSDDLENVVEAKSDRNLTGFTAKYLPFYKKERVSVQVHGGTKDHLDNVESEFSARPKRIEFGEEKENGSQESSIIEDGGTVSSPTNVVNAAIRQDGYASVPQVRAGSENVGVSTIEDVISAYEEIDEKKFQVDHRPERIKPGKRHFISQFDLEEFEDNKQEQSDGGLPEKLRSLDQGSVMEGVTLWYFEEEMPGEHYPGEKTVAENLEKKILEYKDRYSYSELEFCNYLVYDREYGESFEIIIAGKKMRVYAKSNTTSSSFRKFYNILDQDFNSTYGFEKESEHLRA